MMILSQARNEIKLTPTLVVTVVTVTMARNEMKLTPTPTVVTVTMKCTPDYSKHEALKSLDAMVYYN